MPPSGDVMNDGHDVSIVKTLTRAVSSNGRKMTGMMTKLLIR